MAENQVQGAEVSDEVNAFVNDSAVALMAMLYVLTKRSPQSVRAVLKPHEVDKCIAERVLAAINARG